MAELCCFAPLPDLAHTSESELAQHRSHMQNRIMQVCVNDVTLHRVVLQCIVLLPGHRQKKQCRTIARPRPCEQDRTCVFLCVCFVWFVRPRLCEQGQTSPTPLLTEQGRAVCMCAFLFVGCLPGLAQPSITELAQPRS